MYFLYMWSLPYPKQKVILCYSNVVPKPPPHNTYQFNLTRDREVFEIY